MEIKRSKKKQEKKQEQGADPVLEGIIKAKEYATENSNRLIAVVAVVVLVIGGIYGYSHIKKQNLRAAQEAFGSAMIHYNAQDTAKAIDALALVAENHSGSPQAGYAAYLLGDMHLADAKYDQAITWLEVATKRENAGLVSGEALELLAVAHEAKGDVKKAEQYYRRALEDRSISYRYPAIRWKLALLLFRNGIPDEAKQYCEQLVQDTTAGEYRQKAENLLAENQLL
ncbi:MAG: tetratricopeptide repeat protein [Chitinivibrionales bacterium]|nr:tetratricopeptide repeat protein [Chitinivibrionales bacterium]MBD3357389.1 tetratricopeptide repeat protein [Chitinivibrionales bacterium]